jgi:hypothetical protein
MSQIINHQDPRFFKNHWVANNKFWKYSPWNGSLMEISSLISSLSSLLTLFHSSNLFFFLAPQIGFINSQKTNFSVCSITYSHGITPLRFPIKSPLLWTGIQNISFVKSKISVSFWIQLSNIYDSRSFRRLIASKSFPSPLCTTVQYDLRALSSLLLNSPKWNNTYFYQRAL